jgi:hypothetical protein
LRRRLIEVTAIREEIAPTAHSVEALDVRKRSAVTPELETTGSSTTRDSCCVVAMNPPADEVSAKLH